MPRMTDILRGKSVDDYVRKVRELREIGQDFLAANPRAHSCGVIMRVKDEQPKKDKDGREMPVHFHIETVTR